MISLQSLLAHGVAVYLIIAATTASASRERLNFDKDWQFTKGDPEGAEKAEFDDSSWRKLDIPHDWSIEGPFDPDNPSGAQGGYLPTGIGWYRKSFELPEGSEGRKFFIEFDGVAMNGEVWINGKRLGIRPYPYVGYEYDLTPHLNLKGENVLAVRVDNELQPSSRWYTGSGIYRHVWLNVTDPLRVAHWGTQITTPEVDSVKGTVSVKTTVINGHDNKKKVNIRQTVINADGEELAKISTVSDFDAGAEQTTEQKLEIANPSLWSPDSPYLYTVRTDILDGDKVVDTYTSPLGFRTLEFDANKGFLLNGVNMKMKGVCNHHDLGPLGAAFWDDALERRLRMLKEMGCNAIRTAHNPPSRELLYICDRMGFLVVNETFDEWRRGWAFEDGTLVSSKKPKGKAKYGYNKYFDEWAERDMVDHIRRDRNHPCVVMWSIGNEVPEAQKYGENETAAMLRELVHKHDPTRPATIGCNFIEGANKTGFLEEIDIVGYNGGGGSCFRYEEDHKLFPNRIMYASEVPHSLQTRGEYRTHSRYREPERQPPHLTEEEVFPETDGWYESSYDNAGVRISAVDSWRLTKTLPWFFGEFRWTGFDYIGESGGWPRVLGNFGIIDLCNFPKDTYYFYQSQWTTEPMAHLLPHWNWKGKEGTEIPVWCYTNGDSAELFLNGKSLGMQKLGDENDMYLQWMVPFEAGELKAVTYRDGKKIAETTQVTSSAPAAAELETDRIKLTRNSRELSYVTIRMVDKDGNFCPDADKWVSLSIKGPGRIVAVGNGDPVYHDSFQSTTIRTFNGLALAIIASDDAAVAAYDAKVKRNPDADTGGVITLQATPRSLESGSIDIPTLPSLEP